MFSFENEKKKIIKNRNIQENDKNIGMSNQNCPF